MRETNKVIYDNRNDQISFAKRAIDHYDHDLDAFPVDDDEARAKKEEKKERAKAARTAKRAAIEASAGHDKKTPVKNGATIRTTSSATPGSSLTHHGKRYRNADEDYLSPSMVDTRRSAPHLRLEPLAPTQTLSFPAPPTSTSRLNPYPRSVFDAREVTGVAKQVNLLHSGERLEQDSDAPFGDCEDEAATSLASR
jgi:hypothetical protein